MQYYVIYSAGGGAGDRNGVKRVWNGLPENMKRHILLKFGDLYFNHASQKNLIKPQIWNSCNNIRSRFAEGVNDQSISNGNCDILLDSGTSKIVGYIQNKFSHFSGNDKVKKFLELVRDNGILEKYISVIKESKINNAVTFDMPDLFKTRTESTAVRTTSIFNDIDTSFMIDETAKLCNDLHKSLGSDEKILLTTINGNWSEKEILNFLNKLEYTPYGYAIGGLSKKEIGINEFSEKINLINKLLDLKNQNRVHMLGCGGLIKGAFLRDMFPGDKFSADVSTPHNRAIDGNTKGTEYSKYIDYNTKEQIDIIAENKDEILNLHKHADKPLFNITEMENIIDNILLHQSGCSSEETYNARAKLFFHNSDVFKRNLSS